MNKALLVGIGVGVLALGVGVAAASPAPVRVDPNVKKAQDALRTGDAAIIANTGVSLATVNAEIAAGLVRTAQYLKSTAVPSDVQAMIVASVRTVDPNQMAGVASVLQTRGYAPQAATLNELSKYVKWLNDGAKGSGGALPVASGSVASIPAVATVPATASLPTNLQQAASVVLPNSATVPMTTAEATDIANVIATADTAKIRAKATEYRAKGRADIAAALDEAAAKIDAAAAQAGPLPTYTPQQIATAAQQAGIPSAMPVPSIGQPPATTEKTLAAKVALALKGSDKSWKGTAREPREIVQAFQTQEQLARLDGSYGSETALALAERYGIVPPKPLYWGKSGGDYKTLQADQLLYKKRLAALAAKDPARVDEWTLAAKV